jgi:hypothetical protein
MDFNEESVENAAGPRIREGPQSEDEMERSAQAIFVDGHAYGGVHAEFFEGGYFAAGLDSPCSDDGMLGGGTEHTEPIEIGAGHGAFAIDVSAEKGGAKRFELGHDIFGAQGEFLSPAVNGDAAFGGVQGDNDSHGG